MSVFLLFTTFFLQTTQPTQKPTAQMAQEKLIQAMSESSRSVMIIDPKERANDYLKAFTFLTEEKATSKVYFDLSNGMKISNIIDMKLMPGNTLIIFRYNTPQGIKFQVVEVEDILGIMHQ